jgi:hypothetical protein
MMTMADKGLIRSLAAIAALTLAAPAWAQDPPPPPAEGEQPAPPADAPPADAPAGAQDAPPADPPPTTPPPATPPPATAPPATAPAATAPAPATTGLNWNAQADTGAKPTQPPGGEAKPKKLPWRLTSFGWDNSATTETVGIGQDTQSRNPTYEMSFVLNGRYYLWEDDAVEQGISLRGRLDLIREFTNSDSTTKEGEWTFSDLSLFANYGRKLYEEGDVRTDFGLRLPVLTFPTSKVSANNGTILGLGAMVLAAQQVPVLGKESETLQTFTLTGRLGYNHTFTEATTPTNDDLGRVRMGPDGRSLPGDQLSGAAFAQHNASVDLIGELSIHEKVKWTNWFSWRPAWKYTFNEDQQVETATGPVIVESNEDPNNFAVVTLFNTEVGVEVTKEFEVDVGYANLTLQTAPDGTRRNIFYSPDARVYLTLVAHLDEIYLSASGQREAEPTTTAKAPAPRQVASTKARTATK